MIEQNRATRLQKEESFTVINSVNYLNGLVNNGCSSNISVMKVSHVSSVYTLVIMMMNDVIITPKNYHLGYTNFQDNIELS